MINNDVLSNILEFSGKDYLYLSTVSKEFNRIYNKKTKETSTKSILTNEKTLNHAIECGYEPTYKDLHFVCKYTKEGIGSIVNTLLKNGVTWDKNTLIFAIEYNNDDYILWVLSTGLDWDPDALFCASSMFDNTRLFNILIDLGYTYSQSCINIAANYDSKKILHLLSKKHVDNLFMGILAENGHMETMMELCDKGVKCDNYTLNCAVTGNSIDIIEYLLNNQKCEVTSDTIYHSSCSSNPEVRNYFRTRYPELYNSHILDILERYSL